MTGEDQSSQREVVVATHNQGKLQEIKAILAPLGLKILSLKDFPELPEVVEDGLTFAENAEKKAREVARKTGRMTIADDSGLAVDALQGRPGVFSSRYAGEKATDRQRYEKLLAEMAGIPERQRGANFICSIAVASPGGQVALAEGKCRGRIAFAPRGNQGFGYDPVFYLPEFGKTLAEVSPEIKNLISHRARALEKLNEILPALLRKWR